MQYGNSEREILTRLNENLNKKDDPVTHINDEELDEAGFELGGKVFKSAFGKYSMDGQPISAEDYHKASDEYHKGGSSGKSKSQKTNKQNNSDHKNDKSNGDTVTSEDNYCKDSKVFNTYTKQKDKLKQLTEPLYDQAKKNRSNIENLTGAYGMKSLGRSGYYVSFENYDDVKESMSHMLDDLEKEYGYEIVQDKEHPYNFKARDDKGFGINLSIRNTGSENKQEYTIYAHPNYSCDYELQKEVDAQRSKLRKSEREYLRNVDWDNVKFKSAEGLSQEELANKFNGDTPIAKINGKGAFMLSYNYLVHPDGTVVAKYDSANPNGNHEFDIITGKKLDKVIDTFKERASSGKFNSW